MDVNVPDLGDFSDVEVIEILVKPGDVVQREQSLITLETEKATMDVPSPAAGKISEVKVAVGSTVSTGDLIVVLEAEAAEEPPAPSEPDAEVDLRPEEDRTVRQPRPGDIAQEPAAQDRQDTAARSAAALAQPATTVAIEAGFSNAHASPSVRKLARELGVDLGRVSGTGRKERVTEADVKSYVKQIMQAGGGAGAALPEVPAVDFAKFGEIERQALTRIQKISGPRLHASWVNIPHVTQHDEADITDLESARQSLKAEAAERKIKLTPLAFVMRAVALTLAEFPLFKSSLDREGGNLILKHYMHLGFAADTPNGLVVPVIRDADRKDVYALAESLGDLSSRARDGKLKADDIQGGVFTVSSLGGIGGSFFTPIINAPEVAILGVSRHAVKPVYRDSQFVPRLLLPLSLSYDHRVIDGAEAARFITRLSQTLAQADRLMETVT